MCSCTVRRLQKSCDSKNVLKHLEYWHLKENSEVRICLLIKGTDILSTKLCLRNVLNVFGWLRCVIQCPQPSAVVQIGVVRKYLKYDKISMNEFIQCNHIYYRKSLILILLHLFRHGSRSYQIEKRHRELTTSACLPGTPTKTTMD